MFKTNHSMLACVLLASLAFASHADAGAVIDAKQCTLSVDGKTFALKGNYQVVDSFPDFKVQIVSSFPDIKVKKVTSFPDNCGEWEEVTSFPDFKIQFVESFPDLKVQYVESFPGM